MEKEIMDKEIMDKEIMKYFEQINIINKNMARIGYDLLCMRQLIWNMPDTCLASEYDDIMEHLCGEFAAAIESMNNIEKPELYYTYKLQS